MKQLEVGDTIEIIDDRGEQYYTTGDRGVVIETPGDMTALIDFNNQGNEDVLQEGLWWVAIYEEDDPYQVYKVID